MQSENLYENHRVPPQTAYQSDTDSDLLAVKYFNCEQLSHQQPASSYLPITTTTAMTHIYASPVFSAELQRPLQQSNEYSFSSTSIGDTGDPEGTSRDNRTTDQTEFQYVIDNYLQSLSPRKRSKAVIDRPLYNLIQQVLSDPSNTSISTAQFRFWVKRMFHYRIRHICTLHTGFNSFLTFNCISYQYAHTYCCCSVPRISQGNRINMVIFHNDRPVALKEQIYGILVKAHEETQHGGRDKTASLVKSLYSWIPKELIASFVKLCPVCTEKRRNYSSSTRINDGK